MGLFGASIPWNIILSMVNILILFVILRHFLVKPVTNIMEKRKAQIEGDFAEARADKAQAAELKQQYADSLTNAREESAQIVQKAKATATAEADRIIADAQAKADHMVAQAQAQIEADKEKTMQDLKNEIAGLAMVAVNRLIQDQNKEAMNQTLYNQFVAGTGDSNDTKGN